MPRRCRPPPFPVTECGTTASGMGHMRGLMALGPTSQTAIPHTTQAGKRTRHLILAVLAAFVAIAAGSPAAFATYRHMYTNGLELDKGPGYTGLYLERSVLSTVDLASCWPVYATDWTWTNTAAGNRDFVELATAYRCNGVISIIGVMNNGVWLEIAQSTQGSSVGPHTYEISQTESDGFWNFFVDSNNLNYRVYIDGSTAKQLEVLLETYDTANIAPAHNQHDLWYRRYWGNGWARWSGRDGIYNPDSTWMCSKWMTDQKFRHGENVSC